MRSWQKSCGNRPRTLPKYPLRNGNKIDLLVSGSDAFQAKLAAIDAAQYRVWIETYIYEPDASGDAIKAALVRAAARGCDVVLLVDAWGSSNLNEKYVNELVDAGVEVVRYNPVLPWRKLGRKFAPGYHRDHRKVLIADQVGFCGGRNIGEAYREAGRFYDLTLQMEGPVVADLEDAFLRPLTVASGSTRQSLKLSLPHYEPGTRARILPGNRRMSIRDLDVAIANALKNAKHRCYIMTPYLIPPLWFLRRLAQAAEHGVEIHILTAGQSDVAFVQVAGRQIYRQLLAAGIAVYEMEEQILHAKALCVDGELSIVGSYNIDVHGSRHNLEICVAVSDSTFANMLEHTFEAALTHAREMTMSRLMARPLPAKIASWILSKLVRGIADTI